MEHIARTPRDAHRHAAPQAQLGARTHPPVARRAPARDGATGTGTGTATATPTAVSRDDEAASLQRGYVSLDAALLRSLRQARMFSQQDLADDCWRRNIRLSLTTIKRAEAGRVVRFRIAREFARCFDLPVARIANLGAQTAPAEA